MVGQAARSTGGGGGGDVEWSSTGATVRYMRKGRLGFREGSGLHRKKIVGVRRLAPVRVVTQNIQMHQTTFLLLVWAPLLARTQVPLTPSPS